LGAAFIGEALKHEVAALRCGLDDTMWKGSADEDRGATSERSVSGKASTVGYLAEVVD
jgi:hypothetical protein